MSSPKDFLARCRCWRIWKKRKATHSLSLSFLRVVASILPILSHDTRKKKIILSWLSFSHLFGWRRTSSGRDVRESSVSFYSKWEKKNRAKKKKRPPKRTRAIKYAIKFRDLRGMEKGKKKKMWDTDKCRWTLRSTQQKYQSKLLTSPIFSSLKCFVLFALLVGKQS